MKRRILRTSSAMTDIAFLLLLFFLIFAITSLTTPIPIDAADTDWNTPYREQGLLLSVSSEGSLFLQGKQIEPGEIPHSEVVSMLSDKDTPFSAIAPIIDQLRVSGVETIHCIVEQRL